MLHFVHLKKEKSHVFHVRCRILHYEMRKMPVDYWSVGVHQLLIEVLDTSPISGPLCDLCVYSDFKR